jgi:RNA polymerase sigma-70 factor (ECF subfamily)
LYDRHADCVYSLIVRIVGAGALAEEVLQETFWQVWQQAPAYRVPGTPRTWLFHLARAQSLAALRRTDAPPDGPAVGTGGHRRHVRTPPTAAQHVEHQRIAHALHTLSPAQRACVELAYFAGLSLRQIAARQQLPVETIHHHVSQALAQLEQSLGGAHLPADEEAS